MLTSELYFKKFHNIFLKMTKLTRKILKIKIKNKILQIQTNINLKENENQERKRDRDKRGVENLVIFREGSEKGARREREGSEKGASNMKGKRD
jgi:hypothetical protein